MQERHECTVGGRTWWLRTPSVFDTPKVRRLLMKQGVRRPQQDEFRLVGLAGIAALGEAAGDPAEAERQQDLLTEWYQVLVPLREDDIDEPDFEKRAAVLAGMEADRAANVARLLPEVVAIEAMLLRHWPPYAELMADRNYWDEISGIEIVRLLLMAEGGTELPHGPDGMLTEAAYAAIPRGDRAALASFAQGLLTPDETTRKN